MVRGSEQRCPRGIWRGVLSRHRRVDADHFGDHTPHDGYHEHAHDQAAPPPAELPPPGSPLNPGAAADDSRRSSLATAPVSDAQREGGPLEGFCHNPPTGLQAWRVPIEDFAADGDPAPAHESEKSSILQLVVSAVTATHDYSIFGSRTLDVLLTYKWNAYAGRLFKRSTLLFVLYLGIATVYNLSASRTNDHSLADLLDDPVPHLWLFVGNGLTSIASLSALVRLYPWLRRQLTAGRSMHEAPRLAQKLLLLLNALFQLALNAIFWLRDYAPGAMSTPREVRLNASDAEGAGCGAEQAEMAWEGGFGPWLTITSFVIMTHFVRLVFVFRGFLAFGALVHMVEEICKQIVPFLFLLMLLSTGFAAAISTLLRHTQWHGDDWSSFSMAMFNVVNMGFRYIPPRPATMSAHWQVVALYEFFMFIVQIVMLNLLVGFMAQTLGKLRANADLMAIYERARLIIEQEQSLLARRDQRSRDPMAIYDQHAPSALADALRLVPPLRKCAELLAVPTREVITPRWLHVLAPSQGEAEVMSGAATKPTAHAAAAPTARPSAAASAAARGPAGGADGDAELRKWLEKRMSAIDASLLELAASQQALYKMVAPAAPEEDAQQAPSHGGPPARAAGAAGAASGSVEPRRGSSRALEA